MNVFQIYDSYEKPIELKIELGKEAANGGGLYPEERTFFGVATMSA
jgi:hypothetical protein